VLRRIRKLVLPGQAELAGVPAMAAVQEVPLRDTVPRLEPVLEPTLTPTPSDTGRDEEPPEQAPKRRWRRTKRTALVLLLIAVAGGAAFAVYESRTSSMQARFFAGMAKKISYRVEKGPSDAIRFPAASPYDERLGYANLPNYLEKLKTRDYVIASQARMSPKMVELADMGLFATYHEKTRAGLDILDASGEPLFSARFPERLYDKFDAAPTLMVQSLLFIENRELLDTTYPKRNPAHRCRTSCARWDRPCCVPTRTARTPAPPGAASCSNT
jgi:hypothetical protein